MTRPQFEKKTSIDAGSNNIGNIFPKLADSAGGFYSVAGLGDGNTGGTTPAFGGFIFNGTNWDRLKSVAFGADGVGGQGILTNVPRLYNGVGYDRLYNNIQGTLLASLARTTTTQSPNQTNYNARGVVIFINVTAASGTGGLQVRVVGYDPISGGYVNLSPLPTAITAVGLSGFVVYPGTGSPNIQGYSSPLPRTWGVVVTAGDATSYTYSVGYSYIL